MNPPTKLKLERPPKPYPTFPLFPHAKGYWCKTIDGRHVSFGRWQWPAREAYVRSWKAALSTFHKLQEDRAHGRLVTSKPAMMAIDTLKNLYLTRQHARATAKTPEISLVYFSESRRILVDFCKAVGPSSTLAALEVFDPAHRHDCAIARYVDAQSERYGFNAFNKTMTIVAGMFTWAEDPIEGVLGRPFRLKGLFRRRDAKLKRREKQTRESQRGKQRWTRDELAALFTHATLPLRAMMKLAYFAGYGNSDLSSVPAAAVNWNPDPALGLPAGWGAIQFARPKTGVERAAVLPPDVLSDLKQAFILRPAPAPGSAADLKGRLFLTSQGREWTRDQVHHYPDKPDLIHHTNRIDAIGQEFGKLRVRLSRCDAHGWFTAAPKAHTVCPTCGAAMTPMRPLGFYTFRHSAITAASGGADADALCLFEGHAVPGIRSEYVEEIELPRLLRIAQRLLEKLEPAPLQPTAG